MLRQRSSSITRKKFSDCELFEILHLHDCLRKALFDIQGLVNTLVIASSDNESNALIIPIMSCTSASIIGGRTSVSINNSIQHETSEKEEFDVAHAGRLSRQIVSSFHLIWSVFQAHSGAEDEFIWPALKRKEAEQRAIDPSCDLHESSSETLVFGQHEYEDDHKEEQVMFENLNSTLRRLLGSFRLYDVSRNQTSQSRGEALYIIRQVILLLKQQMDNLVQNLQVHLEKEECECLPIVKKYLSKSEISALVGKIMGKRSAEMMTKILKLALSSLSMDERIEMVAYMKKATKGTYFEKWLEMGGWGVVQISGSPESGSKEPKSQIEVKSKRHISAMNITDEPCKKMKKVISSQDNLYQMTNVIHSRTRHPSRWYRKGTDGVVTLVWDCTDPDATDPRMLLEVPVFTQEELTPTYHFNSTQGGPVLGCDHYARDCKVRHPEMGTLHTCRICVQEKREDSLAFNHSQNKYCQEVQEIPVLDRNKVSEILCMRCGSLQPVGKFCINLNCTRKPFAKYHCAYCRLYDDASSKDIYHCPYCNACRKGKGLDIDFRHCMTCNACVAIEEFEGHKCLPKRLEGNCAICQEEMFSSTTPLRGMKCGHAMHISCFDQYIASYGTSRKIKCPTCKEGFDNMRG